MKRTPLVRRTQLRNKSDPPSPTGGLKRTGGVRRPLSPKVAWQRKDSDKVTPGLHQKVLARDGRCMAPFLDKSLPTLCADQFGNPLDNGSYSALQKMQLDHVPDANMTAMGKRAPSDEQHLLVICPRHHLQGWATSKHGRDLERAYLTRLYGP